MDFPDRYGKVKDIQDFCFKAQLVSYEQYRALQEAFNHKMWEWYAGMLVWKNQNPWTALRGFFYDYYLDYTGGYFGYKHGAAPVHIQLNLNDSVVCVLNQTALKTKSLAAVSLLYDMHGNLISENKNDVILPAHSLKNLSKVELPAGTDQVFFLRLQISDEDKLVDENIYWLSNKPHSYEKLNELQKVKVIAEIKNTGEGKSIIKLSNPGNETAFFIRLKVMNDNDELVLPVYFTDNYLTVLPGEEKEIMLDLSTVKNSTALNNLRLFIEGWNVPALEISL